MLIGTSTLLRIARNILISIAVPIILIAAAMLALAYSMMGPEDWEGFKTCQGNGRHWDSLANYCEGPD